MTEDYGANSDVDIAFLACSPLSGVEKWELYKSLVLLHRKSEIDLIDLQTAEPVLRYVIATEGTVLFEREEGLFERYALFYVKQFHEFRPILQQQMKKLSKDIKEWDGRGK